MSVTVEKRVLIAGAAGRDFHDFNVVFRGDPTTRVVAFTATQIPGIAGRSYPRALAGPAYPDGIPIFREADLEKIVRDLGIDEVVLSYSDIAHVDVMHLASRALAAGASFSLLSPRKTMLLAHKPVVAVTAVRTGCGKSEVSRAVCAHLRGRGLRPVIVRHPMPYGDLVAERVQRFASNDELDRAAVTLEEREEYEHHLAAGTVVYAGVDYAAILEAAEREADVIVWDGGNNDVPFYRPSCWITVVDPHRVGHELTYHPGETNLRSADAFVINKIDSAPAGSVEALVASIVSTRGDVPIVRARSSVFVSDPALLAGKRVLLIDDGPTLTHGGMPFGAAKVAAERFGAGAIVDPRDVAVGSIAETFRKYPHLGAVLPAMGYSRTQLVELQETIARVDCDLVVVGTPIDLAHLIALGHPSMRVRYELEVVGTPTLAKVVDTALARRDPYPESHRTQ